MHSITLKRGIHIYKRVLTHRPPSLFFFFSSSFCSPLLPSLTREIKKALANITRQLIDEEDESQLVALFRETKKLKAKLDVISGRHVRFVMCLSLLSLSFSSPFPEM